MTATSWPDAARWRAYLRFLAVFLLFFLPVYIGSGYLSSLLPERAYRLHLDWEPHIPLVPWMVWPYISLYTVYLLPLLHMDPQRIRRLTLQSVLVVLAAAVLFVAFPSPLGYAPAPVEGMHGPLLQLITSVDTRYNTVPSLHVAGATLLLLGAGETAGPRLRASYVAWLAVLVASTVLVHQHHLLDVLAGFALALGARRLFPLSRGGGARPPSRS